MLCAIGFARIVMPSYSKGGCSASTSLPPELVLLNLFRYRCSVLSHMRACSKPRAPDVIAAVDDDASLPLNSACVVLSLLVCFAASGFCPTAFR